MSSRATTFRLATRGSDLALRQTGAIRDALESRRHEVELLEVETTGDELHDELIHRLGKTGAFVHSLDERVRAGEADAAVHSLKDVPTEDREGLTVAAVPERAPANDVLVTPDGTELADLPEGATVGTSSLRRRAQLLAERPDLDIQPLRGNVDTRVEKLLAPSVQAESTARLDAEESEVTTEAGNDETKATGQTFEQSFEEWFDSLAEIERRATEREVETEYDAIVLAEAGLDRLGLTHHLDFQALPDEQFVPAPGQGVVAVVAEEGEKAETIRDLVDDARTRVEATVERTILETLGGGCVAPIGVSAQFRGRVVTTTARVLAPDGTEEITDRRSLPVEAHPEAAREMGEDLAEEGAAELIERAREMAEDDDA